MPSFDLEEKARRIRDTLVQAVLQAADPFAAVRRAHLPEGFTPRVLLATGKASAPMVEAALSRYSGSLERGAVTCIPEHEQRLREALEPFPGVTVHPADHPLATERNRRAAEAIKGEAVRASRDGATTIVLLSGGASAHLTSPAPPLSLDDLRQTTRALLRAGATIRQLNTVRKHIETLKGGGLARCLAPAPAHILVLSDVLGDPLDTIGSGPTAPDSSTVPDAQAVLDMFPDSGIPEAVRAFLDAVAIETPKPGDRCFETLQHTVIANNAAARSAAEHALAQAGIPVVQSRGMVEGEASAVARELVNTLREASPPAAVVFAGETTVTVGDAPGIGGRNQELALAAALEVEAIPNAIVFAFATDGVDGPTDAAGALVTTRTAGMIRQTGLDPTAALARHDSHHALDAAGALVRTGPTGTNINDIAVAIRL